nr:class I SAM-dependent methyltransferase [uncultured Rhodopila sp.]
MDPLSAEAFIRDLYTGILNRVPEQQELSHWISVVTGGEPLAAVVSKFVNCDENREKQRIPAAFPAGHYYSPVVDPDIARPYVARNRNLPPGALSGIDVDPAPMLGFWRRNRAAMVAAPFGSGGGRYSYINDYPPMDATVLYAMICEIKPRRIIEIGCGHSTLCMLDAADRAGLADLELTCIDPDSKRLLNLLRPGDVSRINLMHLPVQDVSLDLFASLSAGDILFIDSAHVLKTGSDVHFELFEILPALPAGVFIHFHDVVYPFEYPDGFIFERGYSWNEAYALRAFLMYNERFRIIFWGSLFAHVYPYEVGSVSPEFLLNTGGSIWIRKGSP